MTFFLSSTFLLAGTGPDSAYVCSPTPKRELEQLCWNSNTPHLILNRKTSHSGCQAQETPCRLFRLEKKPCSLILQKIRAAILEFSWVLESIDQLLLVGALRLEIMTILMTSFVGHMRGCFRPPRDWYRDQWRELDTPGCSWLLSTSNGGWAPCSSCKLCRQKRDGGKRPQILARVSDDQAVVVWTRRRGRYKHLLRILVYILQSRQVWFVYDWIWRCISVGVKCFRVLGWSCGLQAATRAWLGGAHLKGCSRLRMRNILCSRSLPIAHAYYGALKKSVTLIQDARQLYTI